MFARNSPAATQTINIKQREKKSPRNHKFLNKQTKKKTQFLCYSHLCILCGTCVISSPPIFCRPYLSYFFVHATQPMHTFSFYIVYFFFAPTLCWRKKLRKILRKLLFYSQASNFLDFVHALLLFFFHFLKTIFFSPSFSFLLFLSLYFRLCAVSFENCSMANEKSTREKKEKKEGVNATFQVAKGTSDVKKTNHVEFYTSFLFFFWFCCSHQPFVISSQIVHFVCSFIQSLYNFPLANMICKSSQGK